MKTLFKIIQIVIGILLISFLILGFIYGFILGTFKEGIYISQNCIKYLNEKAKK